MQVKMSSAVDVQMANQTLKYLLESESIVDAVQQMFVDVREQRDAKAARQLMNLLQLINTDYVEIQDPNDNIDELGVRDPRGGLDYIQLARRAQNIMEDTQLMQLRAEEMGTDVLRQAYDNQNQIL